MNSILSLLIVFVLIYIAVCTFKYAFGLLLKAAIVISGSVLVYQQTGHTGLLMFLVISPVMYIALSDLIASLMSAKSLVFVNTQTIEQCASTNLVETAPLTGEWISGKTPKLDYRPNLIGDVKALPELWL